MLIRKNEEVYFVCTPKKESCQHTQFVLENVTRAVMRLMRVMVMTAIFRAAQEIGEKAVRTRLHFLLLCFACAAPQKRKYEFIRSRDLSLNVCVAGG